MNNTSGHIVALEEGQPGLMIDINLSEVRFSSSRLLSDTNGFSQSQISKKKLDFSVISYDSSRDMFWFSSEKGPLPLQLKAESRAAKAGIHSRYRVRIQQSAKG